MISVWFLVMSMCRVFSCVVGRGCLLWPVCSLGRALISLCPAFFCTPRPNLPVIPLFLDFLLLHSSPLCWNGHLFWVLVLKVLEVFIEPFTFCFFSITGQGIDLDYRDIEWFALEMNRDHSVVFEIVFKYKTDQNETFLHTPFHLPVSSPNVSSVNSLTSAFNLFSSLLSRHLNTKMYKRTWNEIILCPDLPFFTLQYILENLLCQLSTLFIII